MLPDFDLQVHEPKYVYVEETRTAYRMFLRSEPLRVEIHSDQNGQNTGMKITPSTQKIRFNGSPTLMKSMNR